MWKAALAILSAFAALLKHFFGSAADARERAEAEARARAAEQEAQAAQAALGLETRMQEERAKVLAGQPPQEPPHEGSDLFHHR